MATASLNSGILSGVEDGSGGTEDLAMEGGCMEGGWLGVSHNPHSWFGWQPRLDEVLGPASPSGHLQMG